MTAPLPGAEAVARAATMRRIQTLELLRALDDIATTARGLADDDGTDATGAEALKSVSLCARAIRLRAETICAAGGTSDLAALCDNLSDMTARLRDAHYSRPLTAHELAQMDRDFRNKQMREAS